MHDLDETDREILRLLLADARRPYSEIADAVGLSGPAVSERVSRLREAGVITRFTVNVDRSTFTDRVPLLVDVSVEPGHAVDVYAALRDADGIQHVYRSADARVVAHVSLPDANVESWLADALDTSVVDGYDVNILAESEWTNDLPETDLAVACAECGNTVTNEGTTAVLGGERYRFCCPTCEARFTERYEQFAGDANADVDA
ncbi:LOW QUALITY PROTEIN: transcriptional regulator, AsnC family [Halarchaeum acidiphilum MH1-52-1]|uniref:Transcriptional regulator, AsnC family n=1 Tax=Halarchaeum acidiphilum MH1-52-1 TaxID=1261545 RepID=U2YX22_9EURY|nr:AsnC family transcriptional regulator [Halarchaeum acidiphilum]GAD53600.1 LOW QUALITY PROTEIN: transcriptional regulator, AsnC family [Halarchaeum acidiphilum MH1-52-1]